MIKWLVIIGLIVIPFAHIERIVDQAWLKEYIALGLGLAIAFYALANKGLKFVNNKWLLFVIGAMILSTAFVPPSGLNLGALNSKGVFVFTDLNIDNLWNYKPILLALSYLLMVCAIAQENIEEVTIQNVMSWVGFLMSLVVIVQYFGFQQFWRVQGVDEIGGMHSAGLMGFMAQYTLVSAFICICNVACLFTKRFGFSMVMAIAILMAGSHFSYLAFVVGILFWIFSSNKKNMTTALIYLPIVILISFLSFKSMDNGRFALWTQIYHDVTHPLFDNKLAESQGFTGFGAGAFSVFFPILHKSQWSQAHNEFIEFLFNNGILGLGLLITGVVVFFKQCLKYELGFYLCISLVTCILANGTFLWHLGWAQFYTAVIVGMAYSSMRKVQYGQGMVIR